MGLSLGNEDPDALHKSEDREIHDLPLKTTLVVTDEIVIEDSADSWSKKRGTLTDLLAAGGGGSNALTITTVSAEPTYAATTYNTMYIVTAAAVVEVDLPTAAGNAGQTVDVLATQGATYTVTVDPNASETINGSAASITLTSDYANVTLVSDGTNWVIR
jgi:hypothetical protein